MLIISASCICNSDGLKGVNQDNLLFSGQILPEVNGGLAGVPSAKFAQDKPFVAAVFDGQGSAGAKAACFAAGAFRGVSDRLRSEQDLAALLSELHSEFSAKAPADTGVSAAAVLISGDRLYLSNFGSCRAYLRRGDGLYVLSRRESGTDFLGLSALDAVRPYALSGRLQKGDTLLLCTDGLYAALDSTELLTQLSAPAADPDLLKNLLHKAASGGTADSVTAILLRFE